MLYKCCNCPGSVIISRSPVPRIAEFFQRDFTVATEALGRRPGALKTLLRVAEPHVRILSESWNRWDRALEQVDLEISLAVEMFEACKVGGFMVPSKVLHVCLKELVSIRDAVVVVSSDCRRAIHHLKVCTMCSISPMCDH